ncbi:unnamed protein product [Leptidea sinapis]|uniref:Dynein axonemal assembly factor 1 homolog n=1 Tax=Leptidea sinapis TaxID=189913 RepID=A0A5E4QZ45_9NEOP|nr:unnamed protein product [Leptidea sinapis]
MPITFSRGNVRKTGFRTRGRSAHSLDVSAVKLDEAASGDGRLLLQIKPALADPRAPLQRSNTTLAGNNYDAKDDTKDETINLQAVGEGKVQLSRTPQEKDRLPDRISLDSLTGLSPLDLGKLVFLDVYDNQIEKITSLERLFSLRVLLMGKNRIKRIEGLTNLLKLEVLDLHGNRITKVTGLSNLNELKVLNLAGNQIKFLGQNDLQGLVSLRELNLKRNRLKKLLGFDHTPKLEKLYLANNDLQSVEDVSSVAEASMLIEVSLDGNPVALGGDCTPFLVSYLPNLVTLTNMNVTEQVRSAAMAWRNNKEAAHAAYCALSGSAQQAARRDQVINNARTNWELLRSENKTFGTSPTKSEEKELKEGINSETEPLASAVMPDVIACTQKANDSGNCVKVEDSNLKVATTNKSQRCSTARKPSERRVNFSDRSASQDTDASHSTSTSSDLRLPPILLPLISSLCKIHQSENLKTDGSDGILKRWESISSVEPIVDSSISSLPSSSSDSEEETHKRIFHRSSSVKRRENFSSMRSKSVCDPESRRIKSNKNNDSENASNISSSTHVGSVVTSSTSGSDHNSKTLKRQGSLNSRVSRNIRSATLSRRNERGSSAHRASTARSRSGKSLASLKSSEPVPKPMPASKDREQGVDYLVEVTDGVVSAWGTGAVRRLARDWDWDKARSVTRAAFHYVQFNAVAQALPDLKTKFPNVTHISVRATGLQSLGQLHSFAELRGLSSLTVLPEGNPICSKIWREYAVYRLGHWGLREINDEAVTEDEIKSSNRTYQGLSDIVLRALPDAPLQPLLARLGKSGSSPAGAKAWLRAADPALRDVIAKEALQYKKGTVSQEDMSWRTKGRDQLSTAISQACGAAQRLRLLEMQWQTIFVEMIEEVLTDFANMNLHVKEQMRLLTESLQ